jgi:uncharacterized protein (TIGR00730 family)
MPNTDRDRLIAAIVASPSYRLAQEDHQFLDSDAARGARLELEMMRPESYLHAHNVNSTVVVFGSARLLPPEEAQRHLDALIADASNADPRRVQIAKQQLKYARYYDEARAFARRISEVCQCDGHRDLVIITGGGPGVMEAANRGAHDAGACSVGLNIQLPREQLPNPYITPELAFRFHYFAMRKMHFMLRAQALVAFPGGYGTMDELFEALTLVQTGKVKPIPIVLVGRDYWRRAIDFDFLVAEGFIDERERDLATVVDTGLEAAQHVLQFHGHETLRDAPSPSRKK